MFFYLLYNSSYNKNSNLKEKAITTLIYGSVIYIFIHAIISYYFNNKGILKYFWLLLVVDCSAIFLNSDFTGFSTVNIINEPNSVDEERNKIIDEFIKKNTPKKKNSKSNLKLKEKKEKKENKKVSFNKEVEVLNKDELINKENKVLKGETKNNERVDNIDLNIKNLNDNSDFLNLTLENLEKIDDLEIKEVQGSKSNSIQDLQNNFLKKKMGDELSDPGSDLDLAGFEAMVANS